MKTLVWTLFWVPLAFGAFLLIAWVVLGLLVSYGLGYRTHPVIETNQYVFPSGEIISDDYFPQGGMLAQGSTNDQLYFQSAPATTRQKMTDGTIVGPLNISKSRLFSYSDHLVIILERKIFVMPLNVHKPEWQSQEIMDDEATQTYLRTFVGNAVAYDLAGRFGFHFDHLTADGKILVASREVNQPPGFLVYHFTDNYDLVFDSEQTFAANAKAAH